jgi:ferritin
MLSKKLEAGLNAQINAEFTSAYLYLAMAAWFEFKNLPGSARWMRQQAKEETAHAMKLFDHITDRDGRVLLAAVAKPPAEWKSVEDAWAKALAHEQRVTASIHALSAQALKEGDYAAQALLQWFATEQVEEEKTTRTIREQVKLIAPNSSAMFFLDRHLGKEAEDREGQ